MKARILETGEEITIIGISKEWGTAQFYGSDGVLQIRNFGDKEIEIIDPTDIDWEQRRYEIAREMFVRCLDPRTMWQTGKADANIATQCADFLINELKGK